MFAKDNRMKRASIAVLALLAVAVLSACGGSSSSSTQAAATTGATTTATVTPTQTATTPATTTTTTPTGPPICRAATLAISYLGSQGAAGHGVLGFALRNTGTASCGTVGYPGILFFDKSGKPLSTQVTRTTQDYFGSAPKVALTVAPGETVSFRIGVTHVPAGNATCTTADAIQVIPPNDTSSMRISIPNGGFYECGTATVSPIRPGTSAYPS
jgi:Domain of unknown function (DUF4232)